jgi:hypothetical protein
MEYSILDPGVHPDPQTGRRLAGNPNRGQKQLQE